MIQGDFSRAFILLPKGPRDYGDPCGGAALILGSTRALTSALARYRRAAAQNTSRTDRRTIVAVLVGPSAPVWAPGLGFSEDYTFSKTKP